jgi:hypothetical protein
MCAGREPAPLGKGQVGDLSYLGIASCGRGSEASTRPARILRVRRSGTCATFATLGAGAGGWGGVFAGGLFFVDCVGAFVEAAEDHFSGGGLKDAGDRDVDGF